MKRGILEVFLIDAHGITHTNFIGDYEKTKPSSYMLYIKLKSLFLIILVCRNSCVLCALTMWDKGIP